jgi:nicotinamidase/pyrazinamidase
MDNSPSSQASSLHLDLTNNNNHNNSTATTAVPSLNSSNYSSPISSRSNRSNSCDPSAHSCLLVIDVQNDFLPSGSLAVPQGNQIIPLINSLRDDYHFDCVAFSQDFHPPNHISFYESHKDNPAAQLFSPITLPDGSSQILWPIHCVQNTPGAQLATDLCVKPGDIIIQKGVQSDVDCYSAFFSNNKQHQTQLSKILQEQRITHVFVCGLAFDYCVASSAIDSAELGFNTFVLTQATKGIAQETIQQMENQCKQKGVKLIQIQQLEECGVQLSSKAINGNKPHIPLPSL